MLGDDLGKYWVFLLMWIGLCIGAFCYHTYSHQRVYSRHMMRKNDSKEKIDEGFMERIDFAFLTKNF